ncbi:asparaginase [Glaciimonas soli]|uniref:Asparaginase n=1 Tax=Glaciimonas soli TaxID=2590999 RepID=A0A843YR48_9BURK|nr:asparaginase [Glaciimonas soli]MQR00204.1 asparaginase [Glaciimonas soli]
MRPTANFHHTDLAYSVRNGHVECIHSGSVAVVDSTGRLIAYAGDPTSYAFSRSTLKPFQALPFVQSEGIEQFGLDQRQTALMCASHSGEEMHIAAVSDMLEKFRCTEPDLQCGCHLPKRYRDGGIPPADFKADQRHNNCSGKHAGFLGYCRLHDLPLADYLDQSHHLQREIIKTVARLADLDESRIWLGTDGCNAPNIGLPLARLAWLWAQFGNARYDGTDDQRAMAVLADAMLAFPEMFSGVGRLDNALTLLGKGRWISKTGADGVRCIGMREQGLGIALKLADGNSTVADAVIIEVMRQLDAFSSKDYEALSTWGNPVIRNWVGREVGAFRAEFDLRLV